MEFYTLFLIIAGLQLAPSGNIKIKKKIITIIISQNQRETSTIYTEDLS